MRGERWFIAVLSLSAFLFSAWTTTVGWESKQLPGVEFRQAQTALSVLFMKREHNFSLAYPTPVLGKPWSVPMEFPLYQWTVVVTSQVTGWGITKAGRAVSIACFYLMLPAVWLLLGWWQVTPWRRAVVLALFLTSPLLLFYARAFLMETMALMFALWFCVAYVRAVQERSGGWLALAAVAGAGAGLVKVTTLMLHLVPLVAWSVARLWRERARWRAEISWMAAGVAVPAMASVWWTGHADAIKALNPQAHFLSSQHLLGFNLGTAETRFSPAMWKLKWRILTEELTHWPALVGVLALGVCAGWRRGLAALACGAVFLAALEIFPELYALHDYYYVANIGWLLLAAGLVLVGLLERVRLAVAAAAVLLLVGAQVTMYLRHYFPIQRLIGSGMTSLTIALGTATHANDVLVIAGDDWNSMVPYFAQRRALMLRREVVQRADEGRVAIDALADETIGAVVVPRGDPTAQWIVDYLVPRGIDPHPVFYWHGFAVYFPRSRLDWVMAELGKRLAVEVQLAEGRAWPVDDAGRAVNIADHWFKLAELPDSMRHLFDGMSPPPVRFYAQFGATLERAGGRLDLGAHPVTRLVFALPAGRHTLHTQVFFSPDAYSAAIAPEQRTDGVQLVLRMAEGERTFFDRVIDPNRRPSDRNRLTLHIPFELTEPGEVELFVGPGPRGIFARDWFWIGRLAFE
ncbi:ArnT family glycosyltransferase [Oleiharenicola sp. Vm1]|uniref:ArnT family glycosyltransferase n=1 Tax=Oleiharenicola sp. Vm1 TaxID=3398393 RepID=UPI0039F489E7